MRIVVAMSGGVDSSVAAARLADAGHDVVGLSMQLYDQREGMPHSFGRCCTLDDLHDARRVASTIGIPHYVLNLERQFQATVVDNFVSEYAAGPHADSLQPLQQRPQVRHAGRPRGGIWRRHRRHRALRAGGAHRRRAIPPAAGQGPAKGPVLLPVCPDPGAVGPRGVSCRGVEQVRSAGVRARTGPAGRRQAGQPGDLLCPRRRLRPVRRAAPARPGPRRGHHQRGRSRPRPS